MELPVVLVCDAPDELLTGLREAPVRIVTASADAALDAAREHHPDALVIALGDTGNQEGLRKLRDDPEVGTVPLLVAVARGHDVGGLATVADDVLRLPAEPGEAALRARAMARMGVLRAALLDSTSQLEQLAYTDGLTGLFNRRYVEGRMNAAVSAASRHGRPLCVLVADVDHFKDLNDEHGHGAGDEALKAVAGALRSVIREEDVAGRWGGDEFVILLPDTGRSAAQCAADRIRSAVATACPAHPDLTLTIGLADWRGETPDVLLARADEALLAGKRQGRDALVLAHRDA